jgi:tetratricopeptide (TPR) repeat protein
MTAKPSPARPDDATSATAPTDAATGRSTRNCCTWRWLWLGVLIVGLAVVAAAWLMPHCRNPVGSWRTEIASEDFSDDSWRIRWSGSDAWTVQAGRLVSTGAAESKLTLRQRVSVPVAIEYTARIQTGQRPGDLSVVWSEGGADAANGARTFLIQAGAYDNSYCGIFLQPGNRRLAYSTFQLETGRDYRFRVEIDGGRIAMMIDEALVLEHRDRFPSTSGFISLLGWYPGKSFDHVRIRGRQVLEQVPASAMGDALYAFGHYDDAAIMYGRLSEGGDVGGPVVQDAIFRKGMAERRAGRLIDAIGTWSRLTDPGLVETTSCLRLEDLLHTGQYELFAERMRAYWHRSDLGHTDLRLQWSTAAGETANKSHPDDFAASLLDLRRELFPDDTTTGYEASQLLLSLGRYEDVLRDFPRENRARIHALFALGRFDELDRISSLAPMDRVLMDMARGRFTAVIENGAPDSYQRAFAMCKIGRANELRGIRAQHPAMLHLGKAEELLAMRPLNAAVANECLLALGRFEQAAGDGVPDLPDSGHDWRALAILGHADEAEAAAKTALPWLRLIQASEAGDLVMAARARAAVQPGRNVTSPWFPAFVIGPFADRLNGHPERLDAALTTMADGWQQFHGQRAWRFARAALGRADEPEVIGMPAITEGQAWWLLASAVRAEREGRSADAGNTYASFLALPGHLRLLDNNVLDASVESFVRWRSRALSR